MALESISVGAGAYDINLDTGMVYLAPALVEVLNLPEYGPVSAFADVVHPDDRPQHTRMIAALYKGEISRLDIEFRFRGRDGTWRWARQHGIVVREPDGRARRMVGVTGDITETRQRERQLDTAKAEAAAAHRDVEATREIMQTVLDNMTDGVTLFDKDFRWRSPTARTSWGASIRPNSSTPARPGGDMVRYQIERGDLGKVDDPEALAQELQKRMLAPGGNRYERRTADGRYVEFSYKPLDDGGLLGIYRDITELKEREEALAAAKEAAEAARDAAEKARAEAAEARSEIERTRAIMQTVLDNMNDGVMLFDKDMRWQFTNKQLMEFQRFTPEVAGPGVSAYDILISRRSAATSVRSPKATSSEVVRPGATSCARGARYDRRTASGRFIEFTFKPLADGSLLAVYRDITELKEREEAAEASRADLERTSSLLQTVLDNMSDGVMLLDRDLHIRFANQRLMEFQRYTPDIAHEGSSIVDVLRHRRSAAISARARYRRSRGGAARADPHRVACTTSGAGEWKYLEIMFRPLADGSVLAVNRDITELKEREEALAFAKTAGSRARRRRAHAPDHADRARQHDRRRHVVRQGFPPAVRQPAGDGVPELSPRYHQAWHSRRGHPALPGQARRFRAGEGHREEGPRARCADPQAGRQPFPAQDAGRPLSSSSISCRSPTAACSLSAAT